MAQPAAQLDRVRADGRLAYSMMSLKDLDEGKALIEWVSERWVEELSKCGKEEGAALYRSQGRASAFEEFLKRLDTSAETLGRCRAALAKRRQS